MNRQSSPSYTAIDSEPGSRADGEVRQCRAMVGRAVTSAVQMISQWARRRARSLFTKIQSNCKTASRADRETVFTGVELAVDVNVVCSVDALNKRSSA
jgi:hypothetical protein